MEFEKVKQNNIKYNEPNLPVYSTIFIQSSSFNKGK